eukprot:c40215_g1_i1 orf=343-1398(-)
MTAADSVRMAQETISAQNKPIVLDTKEANKESRAEEILAGQKTATPAQPLKQGWEIPVIDLWQLRNAEHRQIAVDQIALACQEWGFCYVINHGIPEEVFDAMWKAYDVLFQVPLDERPRFDNGPFFPPEILKKLKEKFQTLGKFGDSRDTIRFQGLIPEDEGAIPLAPQQFREAACVFFRALRDVGFELLDAISESLGMERDYIGRVTGHNAAINSSLHHYSPCPDGSITVGLNPHRDIDTLTVLLQDETSGLQVLKEDRWVEVKPFPGSLVVNVGETIQAITNGKYQSVMHRVVNDKEKARSSISCFLLPTPNALIEPLPHLVSEDNPPLYPSSTWETFLYNHYAVSLNL